MVESSTRSLDHVFQALSDPTRRSILKRVSKKERAVGELAESYSISLAAVSKHIQSLERAGLVSRRREGSFSYLRLNPEGLAHADKWIEDCRAFWQGSLSSLKDFIEKEEA